MLKSRSNKLHRRERVICGETVEVSYNDRGAFFSFVHPVLGLVCDSVRAKTKRQADRLVETAVREKVEAVRGHEWEWLSHRG